MLEFTTKRKPLRIHVLSDLHNEIAQFDSHPAECDVVVLAGDIGINVQGIKWARRAWPDKQIIYIPGNHEYLKEDIDAARQKMHATALTLGIHLLDDRECVIGGVRFLGSTLWTDFNLFGEGSRKSAMNVAQSFLPDFKDIRLQGKPFTPSDTVSLHDKSLIWLSSKLMEEFDGKTVVVTHHLPAMQSIPDRFKTSLLSASFASYLNELMGLGALWIHGHAHDSADYVLNGTRVVCNPRGYSRMPGGQENLAFDPRLVIEI